MNSIIYPIGTPRSILTTGYVNIRDLTHPKADKWGWIKEHIVVAEVKLQRRLLPHEHVHHIDENPGNNHPDNLLVIDKKDHSKFHKESRRQKKYNTTKYLGVSKRKRNRPYKAQLCVNGVKHCTPSFKTAEEAALAYNELVLKHYPEGQLNVVVGGVKAETHIDSDVKEETGTNYDDLSVDEEDEE